MNILKKYIFGILCLLLAVGLQAKETNRKPGTRKHKTTTNYRDQCQKAKEQTNMEINNVRAKLLTGGDLWWDGTNGKYIVPKPKPGSDAPEISSLYAGGVWIGGYDKGDNLKIAASTFPRTSEVDYFTGPLDPETGETELEICQDWDRFFSVTGLEIDIHLSGYLSGNYDCSTIPDGVKYWPARGNPYFTEKYDFALPNTGQGLAGFHDEDEDGNYDPCLGDYPIIEIRGCGDNIYPDEMFFWIYNDKGGPHTQTYGKPIQMEVQVQAFALISNDEVNDMTFYRYKLINRASEDIRDTYFAMWIDPDLGCATDDYIGCDTTSVPRYNKETGETDMVGRDLMFLYNEDLQDGTTGCSCSGVPTYCDEVPILGIDYFRGPLIPHTWKTVDGELVLEATQLGEASDTLLEVGMSSFMYYNNTGDGIAATQDPDVDEEYYNYLTGRWKDGTAVTTGGTGYNLSSIDTTEFAFPSDPSLSNGWSMCSEDLPAGDRRTLQVTGPLLLQPGARNELIIGAVWVPNVDYPCPDLSKLLYADGLAQALFDNCFDRIEGPDAPDMCGIELDKELILVLTNDTIEVLNNNAFEKYKEFDLFSTEIPGDSLYRFEGYKIFQLVNENVSVQELDDIDRARLIRQVDIKNNIGKIYNWVTIDNPNQPEAIWTPELMVDGGDTGLGHTFQVIADAFAKGDSRLINHKTYHYLVLAYANNEKPLFNPKNPQIGQRKPYIEGVQNIKVLSLTPRPIVYEVLNSSYGDGPQVTRISGQGVGNNFVDIEESMYDLILDGTSEGRVVYKVGKAPIDVKIYDPLNVKDGKFRLEILGDFNTFQCGLDEGANWKLTNLGNGDEYFSEHNLDEFNEQVFGKLGIAISIGQVPDVGEDLESLDNGTLGVEISYENENGLEWFTCIPDFQTVNDFRGIFDYIQYEDESTNSLIDPNEAMNKIGNGFFTPFYMNRYSSPNADENEFPIWYSMGWVKTQNVIKNKTGLEDLNNVDIVLTSDKSKWSRCVVVERLSGDYTAETGFKGIGLAKNFSPRDSESVGKDGNPDGTGMGMGYFPGYAVDVETGERLNIFFGENSVYNSENIADNSMNFLLDDYPLGEDMIFNPSSQDLAANPTGFLFTQANVVAGGQHVIYVTREAYDGCEKIVEELIKSSPTKKGKAISLITWQATPVLPEGMKMLSIDEGLIPNDVTIKLRVSNPYNKEKVVVIGSTSCNVKEENPVYEFELKGKAAGELQEENFETALDNVNVVPNPYYGFSAYEFTQYSNVVKITNVPAKATVSIYTLDGKFVKQFRRDEVPMFKSGTSPGVPTSQINPDIEWNLKNSKGIPIASGVYLIHIAAPELNSERTIKWFGLSRKFDPSGL